MSELELLKPRKESRGYDDTPLESDIQLTTLNLTDIEVSTIVELLICGLPLIDVCRYIGIPVEKFKTWFYNTRENIANDINGKETEQFFRISRALIDGKIELINCIKLHAKKDWKAAAYLLERFDKNKTVLKGSNTSYGKESFDLKEKKQLLEYIREVEKEIKDDEKSISTTVK